MLGFTFICFTCPLVLHYVKYSNSRDTMQVLWMHHSIKQKYSCASFYTLPHSPKWHTVWHVTVIKDAQCTFTPQYVPIIISTCLQFISRFIGSAYFIITAANTVAKNPYMASFTHSRVCVCVCIHTPPTFPQCGLGLLPANMHYTKTRGDTSSAAHTLTRKEREAPSCLLLSFLSSLPDSNEETTYLPSIYRRRMREERDGQANTTTHFIFTSLPFLLD